MTDPAAATKSETIGALAEELAGAEPFRKAVERIESDDERTLAEQVELTQIPAPPFGEGPRGERMAELMRRSGLAEVTTDAVGNVLASWSCRPDVDRAPIVVSAHLDTVFPAEADITVRRDGDRLSGPGIADDGRGLAVLLALIRELTRGTQAMQRPVLFAATVGEEGVGDLRGVRQLFSDGGAAPAAHAFISLDGAGLDRVVNEGVGSRRYRVTMSGPGGHSWADWGTPNPVHALGDAIAALTALARPEGTTLSVGRVEGGTSVNAIAEQAWMELEVRSTREAELDALHLAVLSSLDSAVAAHPDRRAGSGAQLALEVDQIGHRPGGMTAAEHPLVMSALAATRALGHRAEVVASSTDANVPMAAGIPAITIGAGGRMGGTHTLGEWYDNTSGVDGIARALLTLLVMDAFEAAQSPPSTTE